MADCEGTPAGGEAKRDSLEHPDEKQPDNLDPAEVEALLARPNVRCPTGLRNRCMLELMHKSGCRISEVTAVRRRDIKWAEHCLVLPRTKGGKTRTVPLLDDTLRWLARWDECRRMDARLGGEFFFCTFRKTAVDHSYMRKLVKRLARKAQIDGIERAHPHALRHTCALTALDKGVNIREVQEMLGHKNVSTTQIYTRIRPKDLVEKYRRVMEGAPEPKE